MTDHPDDEPTLPASTTPPVEPPEGQDPDATVHEDDGQDHGTDRRPGGGV